MYSNLFSVFNFALEAIFKLEQAIPQGGMGATKKEIVLSAVSVAAKLAEGFSAVNPLVGAVGLFVDTTVQTLNKAGVFSKPVPVQAA